MCMAGKQRRAKKEDEPDFDENLFNPDFAGSRFDDLEHLASLVKHGLEGDAYARFRDYVREHKQHERNVAL